MNNFEILRTIAITLCFTQTLSCLYICYQDGKIDDLKATIRYILEGE